MLNKRLERSLDLRTSGAYLRALWRLPVLLVLSGLTTQASGSGFECCPENVTWLGPRMHCSDGSRVRIDCPDNGSFYRLSPIANHFDEFIVDERGARLQFLHEIDPIPAPRFCVTARNDSDRWALVCFNEHDPNSPRWTHVLFGILSMISAIFLMLTLAVYAALPELRDIQDKSMACVIAFLGVSYFILAIEKMRFHPDDEDVICVPLAFAMYWTFLSAFFWMNLVAFNVWRSVWFKHFPIPDKDLFLGYCAVGFSGPGALLIAALATHHTDGYHLKPGFGDHECWFQGTYEAWAFFWGPISVLLLLNVLYLSLTGWRLWVEYGAYTGGGLKSLRFNCKLYVKLVFVMGITWIFEVASFAVGQSVDYSDWLVTDVLNCLQGVAMFVLLVASRQRVKKLLARRKPCGLKFPISWAGYDEEDEIAPALPVEMELSNSP